MCDVISGGLCSARKTFCRSAEKWLFLSGRPPLPLTTPSGMSDDGGKEQCRNLQLWHHSRHLCRRPTTLVCLACVCGMCDLIPDKALLRRHIKNFYVVILKKTKQNKTKQQNNCFAITNLLQTADNLSCFSMKV